jgi:Kazal-type serine protease inhibitor domain
MRHSSFLATLLLLASACVSQLPLDGAPCPCSAGLACGDDKKCHPEADGAASSTDGPASLETSPPAGPDGGADTSPLVADPCALEPREPGCGGEGLFYANACDARAAGTTFTPASGCHGTGDCGIDPQMTAVGQCDGVIGWVWGERDCQPFIGCACSGRGCSFLYPTLGACQRAHTMCRGDFCKVDTVVCGADEVCVSNSAARCGRGGSQGSCFQRPDSCPAEHTTVCGCDGRTYDGKCAAQRAGTDVDHDGACAPSTAADAGAGDTAPPATGDASCSLEPFAIGCGADQQVYGNACDARAAGTAFTPGTACQSTGSCAVWPNMRGTGACGRLLGWSWSSPAAVCLPLVGCACTGSGCETLYPTLGACERAHYMCTGEFCKGDTVVCASDQVCTHTGPIRCGRDGAKGNCVPRPASCPPESAPLCGCDGKTYAGECAARAAGTEIDHEGSCP